MALFACQEHVGKMKTTSLRKALLIDTRLQPVSSVNILLQVSTQAVNRSQGRLDQ